MKIITIVGARPQFIKSSIVSKRLKEKNIEEIYIHTGQHYDENMSDIFFKELEIDKPKYNLHIGSGLHGEQTGKMIIEIEKILLEENPDGIIVYGDTNSTLAGAIAASKLGIAIFHVEGGIRNHERNKPEEINRIITDHISHLIFSPTKNGMEELKKEGLDSKGKNVGDVMLDRVIKNISLFSDESILKKYDLEKEKYYLLTLHRPKNVDNKERLKKILDVLNSLEEKVIFPIHPRTKEKMKFLKLDRNKYENIIFIDPIGYNDMMKLVKSSKMVLTDSGGLQKEAVFLEKKCVRIYENTTWKELLEKGYIFLWKDLEKSSLMEYIEKKVDIKEVYDLFGNGKASENILNEIYNYLKSR